ncbi:Maf family protein [Paenibacillus thalictri]|uniref:dTTP/UTP pyrophosphatase n=1 Tax=Paenibacillus thalictri TaxID=2527873 RepID=A0A4Q9DYV4_9BACL|nr:Maf family protein [Paenibacillus thalictri]TBL81635.1 Maf-like protein [Paenibacillus thalictri]
MASSTNSSFQLILASSSPRRQELIRSLGLPYKIIVSDVDESTRPGLSPAQVVEELSLRKALAVYDGLSADETPGIVIGSDTIVVLNEGILGKPRNADDAFMMLKGLQGRTHRVFTGLACIRTKSGMEFAEQPLGNSAGNPTVDDPRPGKSGDEKTGGYEPALLFGDIGQYRIVSEYAAGQPETLVGHTVSKVTFRPMSDDEIWAYVKTGDPLDKAGSYGIQGLGSVFVEKIEGDFYSIMGLPLNLLYWMLQQFGVHILENT